MTSGFSVFQRFSCQHFDESLGVHAEENPTAPSKQQAAVVRAKIDIVTFPLDLEA